MHICKYKISLAREITLYKSQSNKNEFGFSNM
jgi:hypothetical protein